MQITLHILKYVMYADVTFQNDSCFDSSSKCTQIVIDVILLQIHCSQRLTLGVKMASSRKFRAAVITALIDINFVLFDMVSQRFL